MHGFSVVWRLQFSDWNKHSVGGCDANHPRISKNQESMEICIERCQTKWNFKKMALPSCKMMAASAPISCANTIASFAFSVACQRLVTFLPFSRLSCLRCVAKSQSSAHVNKITCFCSSTSSFQKNSSITIYRFQNTQVKLKGSLHPEWI